MNTDADQARLRVGLAASEGLRTGIDSPALRFFADISPFLAMRGAELSIVGATWDSLEAAGLLSGMAAERFPPAREGGLVLLAASLVGLDETDPGLDWIIYLQDPRDPISLYPEAQALKRQCVVHGKPFLSTLAAAYEWCVLEWLAMGASKIELSPLIQRWVRPDRLQEETLALIAHDTMKPVMLAFAQQHRNLLSRFGRRLATGTTGALLNGVVPERLMGQGSAFTALLDPPPSGRWVDAVQSGPKGGDAQIAREVVLGRCRRAVFFEDPHVAREHEADIQLLERATRFATAGCLCLNSRSTADRWADNLARLLSW